MDYKSSILQSLSSFYQSISTNYLHILYDEATSSDIAQILTKMIDSTEEDSDMTEAQVRSIAQSVVQDSIADSLSVSRSDKSLSSKQGKTLNDNLNSIEEISSYDLNSILDLYNK